MKLIIAIVRPFTVEKLVNAFEGIEGFPGLTLTDSEGFGQRLQTPAFDALDPFKPNKRIEIAANDDIVGAIVGLIRQNSHTGRRGDGIIAVIPIDDTFLI